LLTATGATTYCALLASGARDKPLPRTAGRGQRTVSEFYTLRPWGRGFSSAGRAS